MFISPAYAQGAAGGGGDLFVSLLPLILIFVVFYFLLIRPQQKRMKDHREMLANLRRGDRVVTGGGIIGTIHKIGGDDELTVDIAEGVRVKVLRSTVTTVLAKTEPAKGGKDEGEGGGSGAAGGPAQGQDAAKKGGFGGIGGLLGRK
ncbi:MAG: preprotein translocase subunit YajC [Azospirillaceae bacterium]